MGGQTEVPLFIRGKIILAKWLQRAAKAVIQYFEDSVDRQITYAKMKQSYFVDYDYSVKPFNPPLQGGEEQDPYEGEDLVNIDAVETLDNER
jgi:hypothetical protein